MEKLDLDDIAETVAHDPLVGLSRRVMRQIYFIYAVRQFKTPLVIKTAVLGVFIISMTIWVSLEDVFMNLYSTSGFVGTSKFLYLAFIDADWNVEVLSALIFVLAVWIGSDFTRSMLPRSRISRARVSLGRLVRLQFHKA